MNSYFRIDINLVAAVVLLLIGIIAYRRLDRTDKLNRAFLLTSVIIIFQLIIEGLTCLINTRPETWLVPVSVILHLSLFITAPFLTMYWYFLLRKLVIPDDQSKMALRLALWIPQILNLVLVLLSPLLHLVFYIDDSNVYQRGDWFLVSSIITYYYLILATILIIRNSRKIDRHDYILLIISTLLPLLGGLFQTLFYGILVMWSSVAFALIIVFMFLQQRLVRLDGLTGAWNRESYDFYITQRLRLRPKDSFGAIYVDLDHLKEINDRFGHFEGDNALKQAVHILRTALRPQDVIARMGGDEFIVIVDCQTQNELDAIYSLIHDHLRDYNKASGNLYQLGLSTGAALYDEKYPGIESFVRHIDQLMYEEKRRKRTTEGN
jgi:diguanylate cyclase (GGDEF)-like protein